MKSSIKPSIWQQFEEHVYREIDIADSIKFSYLISTLTGADWDYLSLQEQFGSDELIIQHHVKSLINGYGVCLDSLYGPITARSDMREYLMQIADIINKVIADSIIQIKKNSPQLDQQQHALKDDVDHHDNNETHVGEANPDSNNQKQLMTERSCNQNINERCVESSADPQTQRSVESASSIYYPSPVYLAPFVNRVKTDSGIVAERTPLAGSPF
ncbi:hypothetical protein T05_10264 [Trichinella murrelli]|uniref:Uncharacterized protein n=1 Tax=Trichinella murrelli TaxID=144512 RepID=A0A0V0TUB7_9BILA|nr:hypothetical protein T05_10264 [Trichinella murrelli]